MLVSSSNAGSLSFFFKPFKDSFVIIEQKYTVNLRNEKYATELSSQSSRNCAKVVETDRHRQQKERIKGQ